MKIKTQLALITLGVMVLFNFKVSAKSIYHMNAASIFITGHLCIENDGFNSSKSFIKKRVANPKKPSIIEYTINFTSGHKYSACGGYGELCIGYGGVFYPSPCHIPCWGEGAECGHTVKISIGKALDVDPNELTYDGTINTQQDGFNGQILAMPARSVQVDGVFGKFINIPRQNSIQTDYKEGNLTYIYYVKGITFSEEPKYTND
ncbi:MAG: hypothetical protein V4651_06715 [Bacteroidota bacterium]